MYLMVIGTYLIRPKKISAQIIFLILEIKVLSIKMVI